MRWNFGSLVCQYICLHIAECRLRLVLDAVRRTELFGSSIAISVAGGIALMVRIVRPAPIRKMRDIHKQKNVGTGTNRGSNERI
jgi:hypothetical protein